MQTYNLLNGGHQAESAANLQPKRTEFYHAKWIIFEKNACEIFHDEAISPRFQRADAGFDGEAVSLKQAVIWNANAICKSNSNTDAGLRSGDWLDCGSCGGTSRAAAHKEGGVSPKAITGVRARKGALPITNSMVVSWIVAVRPDCFRPGRHAQHAGGSRRRAELLGMAGGEPAQFSGGHHRAAPGQQRTFWFFATIFIFILVLQLGRPHPGSRHDRCGAQDRAAGFQVEQPLFRGANADLNMTLAMALVFFACWIVWALQANRPDWVS